MAVVDHVHLYLALKPYRYILLNLILAESPAPQTGSLVFKQLPVACISLELMAERVIIRDGSWKNGRGDVLRTFTLLPADAVPKALLVWHHGFSEHAERFVSHCDIGMPVALPRMVR